MDIFGKISPRPSFSKRGNFSLCQREVRRDFIINVVIIMRLLILQRHIYPIPLLTSPLKGEGLENLP
jgi:hypothetical protein